jgi:hypothetical protein
LGSSLLEELDFLYTPSADVASDAKYFEEVLGGRIVFAVEGMGARVAMVALGDRGPRIPFGPCCSFTTTGGHRVAVYELARPEVERHFEGRRDF